MVKTRSLYLTWPWIRTGLWRTNRQTDRQKTLSQQYLPVQLPSVKITPNSNHVPKFCGNWSRDVVDYMQRKMRNKQQQQVCKVLGSHNEPQRHRSPRFQTTCNNIWRRYHSDQWISSNLLSCTLLWCRWTMTSGISTRTCRTTDSMFWT